MNFLLKLLNWCSLAAVHAGLTRGPAAARKVIGETLRAAYPPDVPQIHWWDLARMFANDENIVLHDGEWTDGCIAPLERYVLAHLIHYFKPQVLLEVGTYRGCTTRILHDNAPAGAEIYTIDLPRGIEATAVAHSSDARLINTRDVGVAFAGLAGDGRCRIRQIFGSTLDARTWEGLPRRFDFVFIDASHTYEAVRNDTRRVLERCGPGSVIVWHDYGEDVTVERGVGRFIRELMRERSDIYVCPDTTLALLLPAADVEAGRKRAQSFLRKTQVIAETDLVS